MSWMSPHYARLDGLTREHSRLAHKYGLYLYREGGWDRQEIDGVPVLFVPGNAGSFRQVRSLASSSARQYANEPGQALGPFPHTPKTSHLDWFAVDFNEDFSAFHGTTLLEQSEYLNDAVAFILSLYRRDPQPASVILVAHSMGGISARKMLRMSNYKAKSVNTIITLSTPHLIPPVSFDHDVEHIYEDINGFGRRMHGAEGEGIETDDVLLVSIAGGEADFMISSETASVADLVDPMHGFTVFSTSVPYLYSSVDHQAMMWCDQLRSRVARGVLEMIDLDAPGQVMALADRNAILRRRLLPGLDKEWQDRSHPTLPSRLPLEVEVQTWTGAQPLLVKGPVPHVTVHETRLDHTIRDRTLMALVLANDEAYDLLGCIGDDCSSLKTHAVSIPTAHAEVPTRNDERPQTFLRIGLASNQIRHFDKIAIVLRPGNIAYLATQLSQNTALDSVASPSLLRAFAGFSIRLPPSQLVSSLHLPPLNSALLVYSVSVHSICSTTPIAPLLRAYSLESHESLWFPMPQSLLIYLHGKPPFASPQYSYAGGLHLQLWRDPLCDDSPHVSLRIAILASLAKVLMRYRTIFAAWPFAFSLLLLTAQTKAWTTSRSRFLTISQSVYRATLSDGLFTVVTIQLANLLQAFFLSWSGPVSSWVVGALFGNAQFSLAMIIPGVLVSLSWLFTVILAVTVQFLIAVLSVCWTFATSHLPPKVMKQLRPQQARSPASLLQRMVFLGTLALLVLMFAPAQFAYLVLVVVHLCTTVGSRMLAQMATASRARHAWDCHHYHLTTLLLLIALLPLTGPILLVWSRNLVAGYYAPFSSDRNPLRILGFLLWTDAVHWGRALPSRGVPLRVTSLLCMAAAVYILLYGIRYTYSAFPWANIIFLCLAVGHWEKTEDDWETQN